MFKLILINIVIITIIILLFFAKNKHIMDDIQSEIIDLGWVLYTIEDCPHCYTQLDDLPKFKHYVLFSKIGTLVYKPDYLQSILSIEKIYSFPLWHNTKTKKNIYGVININTILTPNNKNANANANANNIINNFML